MFKKTLIAAAIAAMAASGAANAAISSNNGGELFVMAYDSGSQNTFVATLDSIVSSASAFTGTSNLSMNLASDANWNAFTSAAGYSAANTIYQVLGLDTTSKSLWTSSTNMPASSFGTNTNYNNVAGNVPTWMNYYTGTGASSSLIASGVNGNEVQMGSHWATYMSKFSTTAALDANQNFYKLSNTGGTSLSSLTKTNYLQADGVTNGFWNLSSSGSLTYTAGAVAAVPEADTWLMLVAGLGLMGFMARRRVGA